MKKVYIIIPVYNVQDYLSSCLDSVFNQTYENIFVICVNDGSTDDSLQLLEEYKAEHQNMIIVSKTNGGLASARNAGLDSIDYNNESYLTFIDSDDWVDSGYISMLVKILEDNKVDIVCSSFIFANRYGSHTYKGNIDNDALLDNVEATKILLKDETIQSHSWSKIYKTSLFKDLRFDESIIYMEDQAFTYKIMYKSKKVYVTNYAGYYYRQDNLNALTKSSISSKKVVCGLKAYYSPFDYQGFLEVDRKQIMPAVQNALAAAYLTLAPYHKKKKASEEDNMFMKKLMGYIKTNHLIKKYKPNSKENSVKRKLYLLCPFAYPYSYKIAKIMRR